MCVSYMCMCLHVVWVNRWWLQFQKANNVRWLNIFSRSPFCSLFPCIPLFFLLASFPFMAQPYLMGMAEILKPVELFDKDPIQLPCHLWLCFFACCILERLLIFGHFGDIGFLIISFFLLPGMLFPSVPMTVLTIPFPHFREISLSIWRSSLRLGGCDTNKEASGLFMRLWHIFETSVSVLTQEQDNPNKVNLERSTRLGVLEELSAVQITSLCPLYTQAIAWHR